ncbi:MAG: hypothetical protein KIS66_11615 [Fimbriimonadaceae bacterium]|nr:hypothetical protein [Fimbriimonadaceae bacterium]
MIACAVSLLLLQKADFALPSLAAFDGTRWGEIALGESTDGSLKRRFATAKAKVRPEAIALRADKPDVEVEVLLDGRGDKARAGGVHLKYETPRLLRDLVAELGPSEPRFLPDRWEDWQVAVFPSKGVLAQVAGGESVLRVLLCAPERVGASLRILSPDRTNLVRRPDPGEDWDRVVRFGRVTVNVDVPRKNRPAEIANRDLDRLQEDAAYDARRTRGRGSIAYERGEDGVYDLTIRAGEWNDKGKASITVSANFRGETPYGPVIAYGTATDTVSYDYRNRIYRVVERALDALDQDVSNKVKKLGPPPLDSQRHEAWRQILADAAPFRS